MRESIARYEHISNDNPFGLLKAIGGDCAGAISMLPANTQLIKQGGYHLLDDAQLENLFNKNPPPFGVKTKGVRLSLAGAQNKLPVYKEHENAWLLPMGFNASSTYIIKPNIVSPFLNGSVENEAFCMSLAKQLGLNVPSVEIYTGKSGRKFYVVERYDRIVHDKHFRIVQRRSKVKPVMSTDL